jgi:NAD(P) transhydrogenase subunit alpha
MRVAVPIESAEGESRVALVASGVKKLVGLGMEVFVERGCGVSAGYSDAEYEAAGAKLSDDRTELLRDADLVVFVNPPSLKEVKALRRGAVLISFLDPLTRHDLVRALAEGGINAISMEFIPRTTLAQKMDALSSQANLGGYVAVVIAAERLKKILPMMMTPAGTLPPARVFVIGAGVAGLQAIATAKRLGARVEAFDTRPVVKEQVESLGAKFVEVDLGETGQTKDGYAKALTEEQLAAQREAMARHSAAADIVITTAQVFGRRAPLIVTGEMVAVMRPGSVIVDMAVESGGNVAGSRLGEEVLTENGVRIVGLGRLPARVAEHASQMYSANIANLIEHLWDSEEKRLVLDLQDEITDGCLVIHEGAVRNMLVKEALSRGSDT